MATEPKTSLPVHSAAPGDAPSLPTSETREFAWIHPSGDAPPPRAVQDAVAPPNVDLAEQRAKAGMVDQRTSGTVDRDAAAKAELRRQTGA